MTLSIKNLFLILIITCTVLIVNSQELLQSIDTKEALSAFPDSVDDVPADLKIRTTSGDTASNEGFVKFDIASVDTENLSNATILVWGGQHNPSGSALINPYWIDVFGTDAENWPEPFTWNNTRGLFKGELLATENILGVKGGYAFGGQAVAHWIKSKKAEGADKVAFRFHAKEEHPWDIWLSGTWKGMELKLEFTEVTEDLEAYNDTVAKLNFTYENAPEESGWSNVKGSSSFPVNLDNTINISCNGFLGTGSKVGTFTDLPLNVGSTYNYIENEINESVTLLVSGLDQSYQYKFEFYSGIDSDGIQEECITDFYIKNYIGDKNGEFLITDNTYTYNDELKGFKWINLHEIDDAPNNWKTPYDYENGEIYERYEILSQPTNQASNLQFGIWQDNGQREAVSSHTTLNGPGSVGTRHSSPSTWWQLDEENRVDFTRPSDFLHLGIPLWSDQYKLVTDPAWSSNSDWERRYLYHPMTVSATIVAVPEGGSFSGWKFWKSLHNTVSINSVGNKDSILAIAGINPSVSGEVTISISKVEGKLGYINALVITRKLVTNTSIPESKNIGYYPVPTKNYLHLTNLPSDTHIGIYNINGTKIMETQNGIDTEVRIDMRNIKKGIYLIRVIQHDLIIKSFKIIKN